MRPRVVAPTADKRAVYLGRRLDVVGCEVGSMTVGWVWLPAALVSLEIAIGNCLHGAIASLLRAWQ